MTITLKTLPQASAQEVAEQVARHLLTQGKRCQAGGSVSSLGCKYRLGELRCAAGCLIADDEYKPEMEGKGWERLAGDGIVPSDHDELIRSLQNIHDRTFPESWPLVLPEAFSNHNLVWTDELRSLATILGRQFRK